MTMKSRILFITTVLVLFALVGNLTLAAYTFWCGQWSPAEADFQVNPNFRDPEAGSVLDQTLACITGGFAWNNETGSHFDFQYDGPTSIETVSDDGVNVLFSEDLNGYGLLAETWCFQSGGIFTGFDIRYYDADVTWNGPGNPVYYATDIWAVSAHELGHGLGLGHSSYPTATMYPTYYYGSIGWRDLDSDDILGARARYGNGQPDVIARIFPENPRRRFDSSGGSWHFAAKASNTTGMNQRVDIWFDVRLPGGGTYGPVIGPFMVSFAPQQFRIVEDLSLQVPPSAPEGIYVVRMKIGRYPDLIDDESHVGFQKIPLLDTSVIAGPQEQLPLKTAKKAGYPIWLPEADPGL